MRILGPGHRVEEKTNLEKFPHTSDRLTNIYNYVPRN